MLRSNTFRVPSSIVIALLLCGAFLLWSGVAAESPAQAGDEAKVLLPCRHLEEWIPASYAAIAKAHRLGEHLPALLDCALYKSLLRLPQLQTWLAGSDARNITQLLSWLEEATKQSTIELAATLFGRETAVAFRLDGAKPAYLFLTRTRSAEALASFHEAMKKGVAARFGNWPFPIGEARGPTEIYGAGEFYYALLGEVIVTSNRAEEIRAVIDIAAGSGSTSVRTAAEFAAALPALGAEHLAGAAVKNMKALPHSIPEQAENFVGSLLAGGWVKALRESTLLTATLDRAENGTIRLAMDSTAPGLAQDSQAFFVTAPPSPLKAAFEERGYFGFVQMQRDLASFWQQGERLIQPKGFGEMRQFEQIMSLVFGGKSFQDEILAGFGPTVVLLSENQSYEGLPAMPVPALPGFAMVFQMKNPKEFGRNLQAALQTFVGIYNADQAQKGKTDAMLLVEPEVVEGVAISVVNPIKAVIPEKPGMEQNFSGSLAIVGEHIVISSTKELARKIVEVLIKPRAQDVSALAPDGVADLFVLRARDLEKFIRDNEGIALVDAMAKRGLTQEEAKAELDAVLDIVRLFGESRVESRRDGDTLRLAISLSAAGS